MERSHACTGSPTTRGPMTARENAATDIAFRLFRRRRHPKHRPFRGSIAGLRAPLSTLRCTLTGHQRMTRGHRGSLLLRCRDLSSPSPCRFIPALSESKRRASDSPRGAISSTERAVGMTTGRRLDRVCWFQAYAGTSARIRVITPPTCDRATSAANPASPLLMVSSMRACSAWISASAPGS